MKIRKTLWILCIIALMQAGAIAGQKKSSPSTTITILQLNDVYEISPVDGGKNGGLARVATRVKQEKARSPRTLFLLAGDFLSPSLASGEFKGAQMIDTLNATGLDIATLGNHEFDIAVSDLRQRMMESRFQYIVANVFEKDDPNRPFEGAAPFVIKDLGGVRVGIFGLLTTETIDKSSHGKEVRITDPIAAGILTARRLRSSGADIIIALTHLSMCDDKRLAALAGIDLIIGGHEHQMLQAMAGGAHISKMGSDARNLGRLDLHLVPKQPGRGFRLKSLDWYSLPVNEQVEPDPDVAKVVAKWEGQLNQKYPGLDDIIGQTTEELDALAADIRFGETGLGNFIADAYREGFWNDVDAAIVNSGGIRSDKTYAPGPLSNRDILNILPNKNELVKARAKGSLIKSLLENGVSAAGKEDGRFPQVSGLVFSYDASKPVGSRVTSIEIGGKPYEPDKDYVIAVNSYIFDQKGDSYDFTGAVRLSQPDQEPVDRDVVINYIKKKGTISPKIEGRIKSAQSSEQAPALDPCSTAVLLKPASSNARIQIAEKRREFLCAARLSHQLLLNSPTSA